MNGAVMTGGAFTDPAGVADTAWTIAAVGDYDLDDWPDIVWHHGDTGQSVVWFLQGATLRAGVFTNPREVADRAWRLAGPR